MDEGKTDQNNGKSFGVQSNHSIGIKVNELRVDAGATRENAGKYFMRAIFTVVDELRKEMRQYERNTTNLVNTTRTLSERRKLQK